MNICDWFGFLFIIASTLYTLWLILVSILYEFCTWYSMFHHDEPWIPGWLEYGRSSKLLKLIWNILRADQFKIHWGWMCIIFFFFNLVVRWPSELPSCVCLLFALISCPLFILFWCLCRLSPEWWEILVTRTPLIVLSKHWKMM